MTDWLTMIDNVLNGQPQLVVAWAREKGGSATERNLVLQTAVRVNNAVLVGQLWPQCDPLLTNANALHLAVENDCVEALQAMSACLEGKRSVANALMARAMERNNARACDVLSAYCDFPTLADTLWQRIGEPGVASVLLPHASPAQASGVMATAIEQNNTNLMDVVFEHTNHCVLKDTVDPSLGLFQGWAHYSEKLESLEQRELLNRELKTTALRKAARKM